MILKSFKKLFTNTSSYKNIAHLLRNGKTYFNVKNAHSASEQILTPVTYEHKLIENNILDLEHYDFSYEQYQSFHAQYLNNSFFLNQVNKPVLEKIHEDLLFVSHIFDNFALQDIGVELILTGGAVRDFVLGKSSMIKDLDITVNFTNNYQQYLMYQGCHNISSVIQVLLKEQNIQYDKLLDMPKNLARTDYYDHLHHLLEEVIEIKGKHFPIQLLCTNNSKVLINEFDFDISKISLRFFSNYPYVKNVNMPVKIEEYIARLEYGSEFVSHALAKKLSYHNESKTEDQITSELISHFPRVAKKYPEFACDIFSKHDENYSFTKQLFDKVNMFQNLNNKFPSKDQKIKSHKI